MNTHAIFSRLVLRIFKFLYLLLITIFEIPLSQDNNLSSFLVTQEFPHSMTLQKFTHSAALQNSKLKDYLFLFFP